MTIYLPSTSSNEQYNIMVWGKTTYVTANFLRLQKSARGTSIPSNECPIPDLNGQAWALTNEMTTRRLAHCKVEYPGLVLEPTTEANDDATSNTKHHERSEMMRRMRKYNPDERYFRRSMLLFDRWSRKHQLKKERPLSQPQVMSEKTYFDKKPPLREKVQRVEEVIKQGVTLFSARIQTILNGVSAKYKYREGDKNIPPTRPAAAAATTTIHKTILSILSQWKNNADKATTLGLLLLAIISTAVIVSFKNHSLDPCRLIHFAEVDNRLSYEDCATMLQTAAGDEKATQALVFIVTLAVRMEGCFWIGTCVACWYCLLFARGDNDSYRDASRRAFVVYASVTSILCWSIEANTVGFLSYGSNPAVITPELRDGAKPLVFVWGLISALLWIGCIGMHLPVINQQELLEC